MARHKNDKDRTLSGTVGPVVACKWKGITYFRTLPRKSNKPSSEDQQATRRRFGVASKFARDLKQVHALTIPDPGPEQTVRNAAISMIMHSGVAGSFPDFYIDYGMVKVCKGDLPKPMHAVAVATENGVEFSWLPNNEAGTAQATDRIVAVIYLPAKRRCHFMAGPSTRAQGNGLLNYPPSLKGEEVESWLAFISQDGTLCSDSEYTGKIKLF